MSTVRCQESWKVMVSAKEILLVVCQSQAGRRNNSEAWAELVKGDGFLDLKAPDVT